MIRKGHSSVAGRVVTHRRAWLWASLLGFARGMVVVALMSVAMVMLKRLGMSNSWAACGTALLAIPFVLRQLLRPFALALPRQAWWMVAMEVLFALSMLAVAWFLEPKGGGTAVWYCLAASALIGAFHDVMAGDFCNALWGSRKQGRTSVSVALPILATVLGTGVTFVIAGDMEVLTRDIVESWALAFKVLAAMVFFVAVVMAISLPRHVECGRQMGLSAAWKKQMREVRKWWNFPKQGPFVLFIILFSLHECLIIKGVQLFLVDPGSIGGLSLGPQEVAFALSTVAGMAMLVGCVMGFEVMKKKGLRKWVWPMVMSITVPDAMLLYLAYAMPAELSYVTLCLSVESFGCGFGMAGFVRYLRYYGRGRTLPAYGDSCLAILAFSVLLSGVATGFMQDYFGYRRFFICVVCMAVVAIASLWLLRHKRHH